MTKRIMITMMIVLTLSFGQAYAFGGSKKEKIKFQSYSCFDFINILDGVIVCHNVTYIFEIVQNLLHKRLKFYTYLPIII